MLHSSLHKPAVLPLDLHFTWLASLHISSLCILYFLSQSALPATNPSAIPTTLYLTSQPLPFLQSLYYISISHSYISAPLFSIQGHSSCRLPISTPLSFPSSAPAQPTILFSTLSFPATPPHSTSVYHCSITWLWNHLCSWLATLAAQIG